MPKAGASLSERIAALQRKTSNPTGSRSSLSPHHTGTSAASGRLSPGESPSRVGGSAGAQAVRDRIAKFQSSDEKPVLPRSSFGSPAPNPEISHTRRQFPGASSGRGSGAWGEGVLRPQMTGGVWLGAGAGRGWGDPSTTSLRPQMTGGGFLGNGAPRSPGFGAPKMQRGVSDNIVHGAGRDAFADLDDDIVLTGRNRPEPIEVVVSDHQKSSSDPASSPNGSTLHHETLPKLPDTPKSEIDTSKIDAASELPSQPPITSIPEFPEAPSTAPETPSRPTNGLDKAEATPDTSIEIGIHGRSPNDVQRIRKLAQDLELSESTEKTMEEPWIVPPSRDLAGQVPEPIDASEIAAAQREGADKGQEEPWVEGYGNPPAEQDVAAAASASASADTGTDAKLAPADPNAVGTLPQRAQVERTESGRVDPADPAAHQIRGPGLLVPRDEVAEAQDVGPSAVKAPLSRSLDDESGFGARSLSLDASSSSENSSLAHANLAHSSEDASGDSLAFPTPPKNTLPRSTSNGAMLQDGGMTPSASASTLRQASSSSYASSNGASHMSAADKARQAIAMARTKSQSQRLRRPPPGTVLSAADLDASDDEYEPGWASVTSVISSSRS